MTVVPLMYYVDAPEGLSDTWGAILSSLFYSEYTYWSRRRIGGGIPAAPNPRVCGGLCGLTKWATMT